MAGLNLARGYAKANSNSANGRFCSFRLILPPIVHGHNVTFDSLPRRNIQFQGFEPSFVLGITEGFRHVVFEPLVGTTCGNQLSSRIKSHRTVSLKSCFKGRLNPIRSRWSISFWGLSFLLGSSAISAAI